MIKRTWLALVAGLLLAIGLGVTTQPVAAAPEAPESIEAPSHNPQGSHWAWVCLSVRPPEAPDIEHAHVYLMDGNHVRVYCQGDTPSGLGECTWHAIEWAGGQVTGPYGPTPYCELNTDGATDGLQMFRTPAASVVHPGSQTHHSSTSFFVCGYTKGSLTTVQYSNPFYYDANHVRFTCIGHSHDPDIVCSWVAIQWKNGPITGPYDQSCAPF